MEILLSCPEVKHPECRLLRQYEHCGASVVLMTEKLSEGERQASLERGPHRSTTEHASFFREKLALMVEKEQWVVLR